MLAELWLHGSTDEKHSGVLVKAFAELGISCKPAQSIHSVATDDKKLADKQKEDFAREYANREARSSVAVSGGYEMRIRPIGINTYHISFLSGLCP